MKQHHRHTGPTLGKKPKESGLLASLLLWRRAFCLWWKADPRLFTSTAALLLFQTLSPYVTIYFTARLLNEITGACRREVLFSLTGYVLLSTAVLALGSALFTRRRNTLYAACWQKKDQFVIHRIMAPRIWTRLPARSWNWFAERRIPQPPKFCPCSIFAISSWVWGCSNASKSICRSFCITN